MDVGKFLRLQGAVQSAVESSNDDNALMAGRAMAAAYQRFWREARALVPEAEQEEFDKLFPSSAGGFGDAPMERAQQYHSAKTLLASLAGWLSGYVQQARMELEARAYAEERVKAERGVGFRGSQAE